MHSENNENEIRGAEDGALDDEEAVVAAEAVDPEETVVLPDDRFSDPNVSTEAVDPEQTVVMSEDSFSDPDISMEVNVEKLVAELEGAEGGETHRKAEIRRRLEELSDEGDFEDTYAIDIKDD